MEYRYVAVNPQGQTISGRIEAGGEREATRLLQARELIPIEVALPGDSAAARQARSGKASEQERAIVIRELATLLHAGVPLGEAVESIGQSHTDSAVGHAFMQVHARLRSGESLSQGLRFTRIDWPDYLHQLVEAGEHTGKLAAALRSAADQMEYNRRVKAEMRSALVYPSVLVISGIAATLLIFIVVVPKFANMLRNSRAQVPDLSVWVLTAGVFVREHLLWVGLGTAALVAVAVHALGSPQRRIALLQVLARAPVLGRWLVETEIGRWAAMLGTLLENRVPILKAMELTQDSMRLLDVRLKLQQAVREVRGGKSLSDALAASYLLNVTGLNMVRVGERSGELAPMLKALASLHEEAARERLKRFLVLLEPAAILLIGGVIGVIMISVVLAVTSLTNVSL